MTKRNRRGFTLLELMIVIAVLTVLVTLTFPPLFNSLRIVGHEGAMLNMDQSANRALNAVTAALRQAVLPITINDAANNPVNVSDAAVLEDIRDFTSYSKPLSLARFMNNGTLGFGANGPDWLSVLTRGTDFLPFAVPVPFDYGDGTTSVTTLDSAMLPQLGIVMADDSADCAATYAVTTTDAGAGTETRSRLLWNTPVGAIGGVSALHPSLAALSPAALTLDPDNPTPTITLTDGRFQPAPALPAGANQACGIVRFAPFVDETGTPFTITENATVDLNEDGVTTDSYALGRIEILRFPLAGAAGMQRTIVSTNTVLLQTNTDSASYRPLFRLRRNGAGGYVVDIALLLCDGVGQRSNILSFNRTTPFIVRRYNSSVELRNMAFR